MNKFLNIVICIFMVLILTAGTLSALGITPGRTTIEFEPGLHKKIEIKITNPEKKAMDVVIYTKGELSNIVKVPSKIISFSEGEESKTFSFEFILPKIPLEPGLHKAEIIAAEVPEDSDEEGAVIGSSVAVATQLHVYVPYPGKYIDFDLSVIGSSSDGITSFVIPMINRGQKDIAKVTGKIEIYSLENEKLDEIQLSSLALNSGERKELIGKWQTNVPTGRYKAKVILNYDGTEKTLEKEFNVGEAKLDIELITVKDFKLGGIAKFNILVNNRFGSEIKDVFVNMIVYGLQGDVIADFKTPTYDMPGRTKKEMNAFWDTEGVEEGLYDGKLNLNYGQKSDEQNIRIDVKDDSIQVIGITGEVIVEREGSFNITNLLIIVIILLVLSNIIWFFAAKRRKSRNKEEK